MTDYTAEEDVSGNFQKNSTAYQIAGDLFSGAVAGAIGIVVGVPFDFVKVRMQTYSQLYKSSWDCFRQSIKTDGFIGLYRGASAPVIAQGGVNALLFAGESAAMRYLEPDLKYGESGQPINVFLAGSYGGFLQCLLMVPTDIVKCNMQVGTLGDVGPPKISKVNISNPYGYLIAKAKFGKKASKYTGIVDCITQIYLKEGIAGFYRGFTVSAIREIPSLGIYFFIYRNSREFLTKIGLNTASTVPLISGALAGSISWAIIYPVDVVKSNMQVDTTSGGEKRPKTSVAMASHLYKKHGVSIFFRGFSTCVFRAIPVNATTFYFYELFKKELNLR
jgi:hypothetical protein